MNERTPIDQKLIEQIMDTNSELIQKHLTSMVQAQEAIKSAGDKPFLLIDTTLNGAIGLMERSLKEMRERGLGQLADLYLQKLFGGKMLSNSEELFRLFLGKSINLQSIDIRNPKIKDIKSSDLGEFSGLFFSGSPANVTDAALRPEIEAKAGTGITHGEVYQIAKSVYTEAVTAKLPVVGFCYGHQMISSTHGSHVKKMDRPRFGLSDIETTGEYGQSLLIGVSNGSASDIKGNLPMYHGDAVTDHSSESALLLKLSSEDPNIIQGLAHICQGKFTGKPEEDKHIIETLLRDRQHVALTTQGHPEYGSLEKLITFTLTGNKAEELAKRNPNSASEQMLSLLANFFKQYGRR